MQFICQCPTRSTFFNSRNKFITGSLLRFCREANVVSYSRLNSSKTLKWKLRKRVLVSELEGWYKARVIHNVYESEGHRTLCLEPPSIVLEQYTNPGMFVKLSNGKEKPNFFAVASAVNSPFLEFLVKRTHSTAWLCELEKGGQIFISSVMGKGFQLSRLHDVEHIYLLATGSGISPLKAVMESTEFLQLSNKKDLQLYYGVRTPERFSYQNRFSVWQQTGIRIHKICSTDASGRWTGRVGYIQHWLRKDGIPNPEKTGALLCGVKGMIEEVTQLLQTQGVPSDKILTNF
ncbi:Fruit protein pKIWI502 [Galdieria sulphuraria]|uniref:Oxidoreductase NAD-binding domain-containing protein isoform 2 n=1 Tax=Galdieria sulphuraria TaxID=130081 RepID=M2XCK3_GALSU|nr:oxidoreductase NAD-binding domain-containing protein isoform 2 [Galdieria sulphuraria]EME27677.1 oxidoreductase NAD-binding domain-containing protein isoform 2 [Galdieria sulphuraria]GJD07428.1 Fruit protein pKIWI502 [Galdieria sulphuraria]|eukprot:XP_005704197.1 oxidoreductase NAD-binding domain-containing protein isoform 2 [Galdieria sulphuraria]